MPASTVEATSTFGGTRGRRAPALRAVWLPLAIFGAARALSALVIVWASRFQVATTPGPGSPTETYFVHHPLAADPGYWGVITNWDGQWYRFIAERGYLASTVDPSAAAGWAWAFPPGYPLLVSRVMDLTGLGFATAAGATSVVLAALAMVLLYRLVAEQAGHINGVAAVAATSCFVTSPLLQAAYSESLGLLFLVVALLLLARGHVWWALLPTVLLAFTRQITPPVAAVALVLLVVSWRRGDRMRTSDWLGHLALVVVGILGVVAWPLAASALGGGSGTRRAEEMATSATLGWLTVFADVSVWAVWMPLAALGALAWMAWRKRHEWGVVLSGWAFFYPAYIIVVTPPMLGSLRYFLLAFPLGLVLTGSRSWSPPRRWGSLFVGCAALLALQTLWISHAFVYGPRPLMP